MNGIAFKSSACDDLLETSLASSQFSSADQHLILQGWGGSCCFPSYYCHNLIVLKHLLSRCVSSKDMFKIIFILVLWLLIFLFRCSNHLLGCIAYCPGYVTCRHSNHVCPCQTTALSPPVAKLKYESLLWDISYYRWYILTCVPRLDTDHHQVRQAVVCL